MSQLAIVFNRGIFITSHGSKFTTIFPSFMVRIFTVILQFRYILGSFFSVVSSALGFCSGCSWNDDDGADKLLIPCDLDMRRIRRTQTPPTPQKGCVNYLRIAILGSTSYVRSSLWIVRRFFGDYRSCRFSTRNISGVSTGNN